MFIRPRLSNVRSKKDKVHLYPSEFTANMMFLPDDDGDLQPFTFKGREYLLPVYDTPSRRVLLKFGRQAEKTVQEDTLILTAQGAIVPIKDVQVGDMLTTLLPDGAHMGAGPVVWKSRRYEKSCVRVTTQLGHSVVLGVTHPVRQWNRWVVAGDLKKGDRVASVRSFPSADGEGMDLQHVAFVGYILGDGSCAEDLGFTQDASSPALAHFRTICADQGWHYREYAKKDSQSLDLRFNRDRGGAYGLIEELGLIGCTSETKHIPDRLMRLPRAQSVQLLQALWACDGHISKRGSRYEIVYCSISEVLARQVQALLWKIGVPSRIRTQTPTAYRGTGKRSFLVHVRTRLGIENFLSELDIPGKTARTPDVVSNDNRDTYPREAAKEVHTRYRDLRLGQGDTSHAKGGPRMKAKYPPSKRKFSETVAFLKSCGGYVDDLVPHIDTDIFWDTVVSVEEMGTLWCFDLEVEATHNFIAGGLVTHNSTYLGNSLIAYSILRRHFRSLLVTPTQTQTETFSRDKLATVITNSKRLQTFIPGVQSVFRKVFTTGSEIDLRYAFLHADRTRGIPKVDLLCFDLRTEVLTRSGWVCIGELTEEHEVADVQDDGSVVWSKPTNIFVREHNGMMVSFKHEGFSLRVTGDHRMWASWKMKPGLKTPNTWGFETALTLAATNRMGFKLTSEAHLQGHGHPDVVIPELVVTQRTNGHENHGRTRESTYPGAVFPLKELALFMGWFLSGGHLQRSGTTCYPVISQNSGENLDRVIASVEALVGDKYWVYYPHGIDKAAAVVVKSAPLGRYLSPLGGCYEKRIPTEFFQSEEVLLLVLEGIHRGDGMHRDGCSWDRSILRTRSLALAEDVQRAWALCGRGATVRFRMVNNKPSNPTKGILLPMYDVNPYVRTDMMFWRSEFDSKDRVFVEATSGENVGCFSVPSGRTIVRGAKGSKPVVVGQCLDEVQDILADVIPIIEETQKHSSFRLKRYSGTPKSVDNTIARYWQAYSTQYEWAIPCDAHTPRHWVITGMANVGKHHLICEKCGNQIYPAHPDARWVSMRTPEWLKDPPTPLPFEGYRIPQIITPWVDWDEVVDTRERYTVAQFHNEVLGMEYDSSEKLITVDTLRANSGAYTLEEGLGLARRAQKVWMGIDWGSDGESKTVVTVGGYFGGKFSFVYMKRFVGEESTQVKMMPIIKGLIADLNVSLVGVDYGGGLDRNDELIRAFGIRKIIRYQYVNTKKLYFDKALMRWMANRTEALMAVINCINRQGEIEFPKWEAWEQPFAQDLLSVFKEYNTSRRTTVINRTPGMTDDTLHSMVYCFLASMMQWPRPDILAPDVDR